MYILKQSTAVTVKTRPFFSSSDAVTAMTALTIAQADVILFKNNGAGAQKNDSTSATHDTGGVYGVPLNTTDTATVGPLQMLISKSSALPMYKEWMVVPAHVYNGLVAGTGNLNVNVDSLGGSTAVVAPWLAAVGTITTGTVDNTAFTATTSVLETSSITTAATDHWLGRVIVFTSGTLALQATRITAYSLSSGRGRFTYNTVTSAPASGVSFVII
jgi:hypothetical protein